MLVFNVLLVLLGFFSGTWSPGHEGPGGTPGENPAEWTAEAPTSGLGNQVIPDSLIRPSHVPGIEEALVLSSHAPGLEDRLRVVFWPGHEGRAQRVVETLERRPVLPAIPPGHPTVAIIFLAPDQERWESLTGGQAPHWGAGVAIPSRARIVMPVFQTPWDGFQSEAGTIRHEWAHLGLHDYLSGLRIPRWFDEGYAQWASGSWNVQEAWRLRLILAGGQAPPLDSLTLSWPADRASAQVAYLLSATALHYLVEGSGTRGLELFLERWRESGSFEDSFRRTYGITTGTFERQWLEHVKRRYGFVLILGQSVVFWLLLGVGLLVLFRIRRRRDRERMARLRAEEMPELPAYWSPPQTPPVGGFTQDLRRKPGSGEAGPGKEVETERVEPGSVDPGSREG